MSSETASETEKANVDTSAATDILSIIATAVINREPKTIGAVEAIHKPSGRRMLCVVHLAPSQSGKGQHVTPLFFVDPEHKMMGEFEPILGDNIIKAEKH